MKDFLDGLDDRLTQMADDIADEALAEVTPVRRRRSLRRPAFLGAATGSLAILGTVFALSGTSLADLPILSTETTDASSLKGKAGAPPADRVDFKEAHAFGTPGGPGYVMTSPERDTVCLTIPDATTPGEYGSSCSSLSKAEREGIGAEIVGDRTFDPGATNTFAFVLPEDAGHVRLRAADGKVTEPKVESGVVAAQVTARTVVEWTVDGRRGTATFEGPFGDPSGLLKISCPDQPNKSVDVRPEDVTRAGTGPGTGKPFLLDQKALREACS